MEALFDSINVRDLLSARDLSDPSSPLSAPDLRLLTQRLESHSLQIKSKVQSYILSHHEHFANLFSICNDAVSQSDSISANVADLLRFISSDRPVDVEIRDLIDEVNAKVKESRTQRELLDLVRAIAEINDRFEGVREALRNGRFRFAAEDLTLLKKALHVDDDDADVADQTENQPLVYALLKKEWSDCFEEIQEVLVKFMENGVRFELETRRLRVQYRLSHDGIKGIELRTVFEAMDAVGILDYGLAKVADLIIKHVITPVVNRGSPISFVEEVNQDSKEMTEAILKIVPSIDPKIENVEGEAIYSGIIQVVKFIYKFICFENGSWIHSLGRLTWPRIAEMIISNFLSKVVPKDASKLADFQKIIECTSQFETGLKEMLFISASDNKDERLSNFAENVEVHFASRKKAEILAKARKLLLHCDFDVPQEYTRKGPMLKKDGMAVNSCEQVVDLLFLSESCVVSKAVTQLMELVHQTLKDVCLSSTRVALEFYHAARDAMLLYEVVMPVKYRSDFPNSIKEHAIFVDMAPRFQLMAEEILQMQIQLIIYNLKEAVDGADGFQNTYQKQQFELAKFSIDQVIFILEKVHIIWEPLLLPSTYKRSMCMVLETVFSRITKDILLLDDMAADETLQLQRLIHLMLENLSSLFESLSSVSQKRPREDSTASLDHLIPSLCKIRKLAELLDLPLKSITTDWERGELLNCGFTLSEVEYFIKAIFTDSPLRKECLWRIENSSFESSNLFS
nr:centromere/kinetochore protein zw10 like [Quercus suber]